MNYPVSVVVSGKRSITTDIILIQEEKLLCEIRKVERERPVKKSGSMPVRSRLHRRPISCHYGEASATGSCEPSLISSRHKASVESE
ncbi:MAG: hypothetical protein LKH33_03235 [Acetobacter sp.]|nr:hypothetical protein [Acetobacter sp.]MCH4060084.1 hypothetical protein [Acetobacter sp.]MCH4087024.1 hypothetical protein [Acetobacter sp.]MCI1292844.1 hypothetical protein [Acetobacter sp.]MCI1319430.1 hypothetical protein [Acetobacter sp.]